MIQLIHDTKSRLRKAAAAVFGYEAEFARRIKHRHNAFWKCENAEIVRSKTISADQSFAEWKEGEYWQRKLSHKYNAREFARMHGCKLPGLYWKGRDVSEIDFDKLPAYYIIRPTIGHSCKFVFLMANSVNVMDKQSYLPADIIAILSHVLKQNPYLEFLVEEFVRTEKGEYSIPDDYKFYMFNGEVAVIEVINRFGPDSGLVCYYDTNWNMITSIVSEKKYSTGKYQEKPACFSQMLEQAKRLSKAYEIFVRIDFYATDKGCVFGEFTPTPGSAKYFTSKGDKLFIKHWDSYCNGMI